MKLWQGFSNRNALRMGNLPVITYATCVSSFVEKSPIFNFRSRICEVALRVYSHVACLMLLFLKGRLAMPSTKRSFEARRVFFVRLVLRVLVEEAGRRMTAWRKILMFQKLSTM
jgi:hypothetical protein